MRKNGKLILFSQEPYTTRLVNAALPNVPFNYRMVWVKDTFANHLGCNRAPVSYYEDILVFSKKHDLQNLHTLRPYFTQVLKFINRTKKEILGTIGTRADHVLRVDSPQFALCTAETYELLTHTYMLDSMEGYRIYEDLRREDLTNKNRYASTFNLWEGNGSKGNIFYYPKDMDGHHPTQKPVLYAGPKVY